METLLNDITSSVESRTIELKKGDTLFDEGEISTSIAFVEHGCLVLNKNNRSVLLRTNNEPVDLIPLFSHESTSFYSLQATSDTKVRLFDRSQLQQFVMDRPQMVTRCMQQVICQLNKVDNMIQILRETSATKRLLSMMMLNTRSEGIKKKQYYLEPDLNKMASISNISSRRAKKVLSNMESKNIVRSEQHKLIIKDMDALKLLVAKADFLGDS
ncbi:MAG: Crp/Fnr family transcriptional regulator [Crocinitomicaceae bacterium]|nr:Crp/Fnr family transcriptional regulator [Crocinitomicaceae bacterium]